MGHNCLIKSLRAKSCTIEKANCCELLTKAHQWKERESGKESEKESKKKTGRVRDSRRKERKGRERKGKKEGKGNKKREK